MKSFHYLPLVMGLAVFQGAAASETFHGKASGMGRTSASADFMSASLNPALVTRYDETDDFGFNINIGALISDRDDLVDTADDIRDQIKDLEDLISMQVATPNDAQSLLDNMRKLDGKKLDVQAGASINVGIPNRHLSATLVINATAKVGATFNYDRNDELYLLQAIATNNDDLDGFNSTVAAQGYAISEVGIALGRVINLPAVGAIGVGVTPKLQRIDLYDYTVTPKEFDDSDFDADDYATDKTAFNMDIGVAKTLSNHFHTGVTIENLIPVKATSKTNTNFHLRPTVMTSVGYDNGYFAAGVDLDLTAREGYDRLGDNQYVRAGIELDAWKWAQLRLGFQHDLKDNDEDLISAGIGLSPFDVINVDISAMYGSNNTYGAALQIGFKI